MNAERPPHARSVASATGVAPAETAAAKTLSTPSRASTVQARVTPDHPVGSPLPARPRDQVAQRKERQQDAAEEKPGPGLSPLGSSGQPSAR
jgi:hypothetical protein